MSGNATPNPIMVAVDGSPGALDAVRWAAAQAVLRGTPLRVVHAYDWQAPLYGPLLSDRRALREAARQAGDQIMTDAVAEAVRTAPDVICDSASWPGQPVPVLSEASKHAAMMVLGCRGLGGFGGLLVGSVSATIAAHAACPVVVVRGESQHADGPIVLGVDGSHASEVATSMAFEEAALRGCSLVAVQAWTDTAFTAVPYGGFYPAIDWAEVEHDVAGQLAGRLAIWQDKYPDVPVRPVLRHDRPVAALLEQAANAQLVVVGSRGRGPLGGLTLGSVSQALVHHAPCPVLIARTTRTD